MNKIDVFFTGLIVGLLVAAASVGTYWIGRMKADDPTQIGSKWYACFEVKPQWH